MAKIVCARPERQSKWLLINWVDSAYDVMT
jgi:hypothetical protein